MPAKIEGVKKYIPQREPMIMVDKLVEYKKSSTHSAFTILPNNVFVSDSYFIEAGLLENMAQTAALSKGYEYSLKNEKPPLGFIGAVKNFEVVKLPKIGDTISTIISIKHQVLNASIINAQISLNSKVIAFCELKIFLNPEID